MGFPGTFSKIIWTRLNFFKNQSLFWKALEPNKTLHEKCPNKEFFLVRIFLYSVQIQKNTDRYYAIRGAEVDA